MKHFLSHFADVISHRVIQQIVSASMWLQQENNDIQTIKNSNVIIE